MNSGAIRARILDMHHQGLSIQQMCQALGVNKDCICYHRKVLGLVKPMKQKQKQRQIMDILHNPVNRLLSMNWKAQ